MTDLERRQQSATFGGSARRNVRRNVEVEYKGMIGDNFQDDELDVCQLWRQ